MIINNKRIIHFFERHKNLENQETQEKTKKQNDIKNTRKNLNFKNNSLTREMYKNKEINKTRKSFNKT